MASKESTPVDSSPRHTQAEFEIESLGPRSIQSPLVRQANSRSSRASSVFLHIRVPEQQLQSTGRVGLECGGPRSELFFDPPHTVAGIVTCGGLCPGLNNVIRALVLGLHHRYGVRKIYGFRYGYEGLTPGGAPPMELTIDNVKLIHEFGGTILGTSRGPQDLDVMADYLRALKVNVLFAVGGDGTLRGAHALSGRIKQRGDLVSVIGIPKSIDSDVMWLDKTFGFETAVDMAQAAISGAHAEAKSCMGGIGVVKLMGRESGFIALHASLASGDVNLVLLPEVKFTMAKVTELVAARIKDRGHCVIVIAEGAGLDIFGEELGCDASGNKKLPDVGVELCNALKKSLNALKLPFTLKYIDPSYIIRSSKPNTSDSILCFTLAHAAVHAAMAGKTNMVVSMLHGESVHVPIEQATAHRKKVDTSDLLYQTLLDSTGMPFSLE